MKNQTIKINGDNYRYLSQMPEFQDGLPHGVINKTKTDVGGTFACLACESNYIIICPFRDLVDSLVNDKNSPYSVFGVQGGTTPSTFNNYIMSNNIHKIAVTYNSFPKLVKWMRANNLDLSTYKIVVDEYHLILEDMDFREDVISNFLLELNNFKHYSFLSATPIDINFEIEFLKKLPHYEVIYNNLLKVGVKRFKLSVMSKGLCAFIDKFLKGKIQIPDIYGNIDSPDELYIYINSVQTIKQVLDTLKLDNEEVKICCADRKRNELLLGEYEISLPSSPNKKITFLTKKGFQGCNFFSNSALVVVCSDGRREQTLTDIFSSMEQIAGRLRVNEQFKNRFRNTLIHLYSINKLKTDEEFEEDMKIKEQDAIALLNITKKISDEEVTILCSKLKLENEVLSQVNGKLVYNELKKQNFRYKQKLRNMYKNGISIRDTYNQSKKFVINDSQKYWGKFDLEMAKLTTVSYQQLLKDYLETRDEDYVLEYPEFVDIAKYLDIKEMNTLHWNKQKLINKVKFKKTLIFKILTKINKPGFYSNAELKKLFSAEFKKYGFTEVTKPAWITKAWHLEVEEGKIKQLGKTVNGYKVTSCNMLKF